MTKNTTRYAECHPDRKHAAHGLCESCARVDRRRRAKKNMPPRGPSDRPRIPNGHELSGVSALVGPDGAPLQTWEKTRIAGGLEAPHDPEPEGHHVTGVSTLYRGDGTVSSQWVRYEKERARQEQELSLIHI